MIKNYVFFVSLIFAVNSLLAGDTNSPANTEPKKLRKFQEKYDVNKNGILEKDERQQMLKELDKNGNGKIDKDEVPKKKKKDDDTHSEAGSSG